MALYAEGVTILLLAALHLGLVVWAGRNIWRSKFSGFEKGSWLLVALVVPLLGSGIYAAYAKNYLTKEELRDLFLATALLGLLFSFRRWGEGDVFSVSLGLNYWLRMSGLALITLLAHVWVQKGVARHFDSMARFRLWKLAGLLAICLAFLTNGFFMWAAIGCVAVESWIFRRPGRKGSEQTLGFYEIGKIVSAGAFASVGLAALAKVLSGYFAKDLWRQLMVMNIWYAIFSVVPFVMVRFLWSARWSQLTSRKAGEGKRLYVILRNIASRTGGYQSGGEHIWFGSRLLWVFTAVFVVVSSLLLLLLRPIASVLIAAVLAVVVFAVWHHYLEPGPHKWRD